ncbi:hypothetical protein T439DRAFT_380566 [Meredithblackwellia eburnea MCA 4105]
MKKEGWLFLPNHILPPLVFNSLIGFTLFWTYTTLTSPPYQLHPFLSGFLSGGIQSLISAPLDAARISLTSAGSPSGATFKNWRHSLLQQRHLRNSYRLFHITLIKDSLAFGTFFTVFEYGRAAARIVGREWVDGVPSSFEWEENSWSDLQTESEIEDRDKNRGKRSKLGLGVQALCLLLVGGFAGWTFEFVARPLDRVRGALWEFAGSRKKQHPSPSSSHVLIGKGRKQRKLRMVTRSGKMNMVNVLRRGVRKRVIVEFRADGLHRRRFCRGRLPRHQLVEKGRGVPRHHRTKSAIATRPQSYSSPDPKVSAHRRPALHMPLASSGQPQTSLSVLRQAVSKHGGVSHFLFARALTPSSAPVTTMPSNSRRRTLLPGQAQLKASPIELLPMPRWARVGSRILSYCPPYALGLLVYAALSGDLS